MTNTKPRLGLDLDGVIADRRTLKSSVCMELFQKEIPPRYCGKLDLLRSYLTLEEYKQMSRKVYLDQGYVLSMRPIPYAVETIAQINRLFDICIVTSCSVDEVVFVHDWLKKYGISIDIVAVGGRDKRETTQGMDIFVDDDIDKLQMIDVPRKILFSGEHNMHDNTRDSGLSRVHSWEELESVLTSILPKV